MDEKDNKQAEIRPPSSRMPADSTFYDKVLPFIFITLAIFTIALVIFALGVLLGFIPF